MRIASLPWYDLPPAKHHLDSVYDRIHQQLINNNYTDLPARLDRQTPLAAQWSDASLFLSQCCGPDLQTQSGSALQVIARPVFDQLDCSAGNYYSHIVAKSKYVNNTPNIAVNSSTSFSGCTALLGWLTKTGRKYKNFHVSGSHQASLQLLLSDEVDVAAIDAHSWRFMRHDGLVVIDRSQSAPAPPFVCHTDCSINRQHLFDSIAAAFHDKGKPLYITRVLPADNQFYQSRLTTPSEQANQ